jgi:colicin import membrane protein
MTNGPNSRFLLSRVQLRRDSQAQAPGKRMAIVLAVLVHLGLAAFLIYGIRWQTKVSTVVEAELVREVPATAKVEAAAEPKLEPKPESPPEPEPKPPPKPEPKPQPKPTAKPPPPPKPDIAIKEKPKPAPPPPPDILRKMDPFQRQMAEEEKRLATRKLLVEEERRLRQQQEAQAASQEAAARSKALASYTDRIRAKIRGNIVLPPELKGNPSAVFEVAQLPTGEVVSVRLTKSSGHAGYDAAVERAILKSSPLPLPDDRSLFERSLRLIFCPVEDGKCG